jgi:hypothetical protein
LALVALHNRGHLSGADFRGPRLDLQDLEELCHGELICLTGPPRLGVLAPTLERCADPSNPVEAFSLTRRLRELFPDRLYLEISYQGHPREKVVNRALMALSNRFDLPLVATNAVRYARGRDAQAAAVLQAMRANRRTEDSAGLTGAGGGDRELPIVSSASTVVKAQAYNIVPSCPDGSRLSQVAGVNRAAAPGSRRGHPTCARAGIQRATRGSAAIAKVELGASRRLSSRRCALWKSDPMRATHGLGGAPQRKP